MKGPCAIFKVMAIVILAGNDSLYIYKIAQTLCENNLYPLLTLAHTTR